jgi:AcrR family transcriptional regulator
MSGATSNKDRTGQYSSDAPTNRRRPSAGNDPVKRQQIIDGARRVFMRLGFDAASMNDITREAGVSKGTIYVYFASKEELFEALVEEERTAIFRNLYETLDNPGDLRSTLTRFGTGLALRITSNKVILAQRVVIGAADRIPELGRRFYERGPKHGHDRLVAFLSKAVERDLLDIRDVTLAAYQLTELCLAGLARQRLFGFRPDAPTQEEVERIASAGVDMFLKTYGTAKLAALERARES